MGHTVHDEQNGLGPHGQFVKPEPRMGVRFVLIRARNGGTPMFWGDGSTVGVR